MSLHWYLDSLGTATQSRFINLTWLRDYSFEVDHQRVCLIRAGESKCSTWCTVELCSITPHIDNNCSSLFILETNAHYRRYNTAWPLLVFVDRSLIVWGRGPVKLCSLLWSTLSTTPHMRQKCSHALRSGSFNWIDPPEFTSWDGSCARSNRIGCKDLENRDINTTRGSPYLFYQSEASRRLYNA